MVESSTPDSGRDVPTLFCLMGETLYDELEYSLAPSQPVISMFDMRELMVISRQAEADTRNFNIEEIAQLYLRRVRTLQPTGPYRIGGFSAGGAVAFEVAHRLIDEGEDPAMVVLFDTLAISGLRKRNLLERQLVRLAGLQRKGPTSAFQFLDRLRARIRYQPSLISDKTTSRRMSREELDGIRAVFYRQALIRYETRPYPGDVIVFKAQIADRPGDYVCDESLGWSDLISGALEVHEYPCDHLGILAKPHVQDAMGGTPLHVAARLGRVAEKIIAFSGDRVSETGNASQQTIAEST